MRGTTTVAARLGSELTAYSRPMSAPAPVSMLHEGLEALAAHAHSELLDRVGGQIRPSHGADVS